MKEHDGSILYMGQKITKGRKTVRNFTGDVAVSSVVGEMLMLSVVMILVALFAASMGNFVPEEREPSVNILVGDVDSSHQNVTLWHKGGDIVPIKGMKVLIGSGENRQTFTESNFIVNDNKNQKNFMPGDYLTVCTDKDIRGEDITVIVSSSVVMYGRIRE